MEIRLLGRPAILDDAAAKFQLERARSLAEGREVWDGIERRAK